MRRLARVMATGFAVAQLGACGGPPGPNPAPSVPVTVTVTNNGNLDADVYGVGSGGRYHLGFVPTGVTATMYLPSYVVSGGTLRLLVRRIGASRYWTPAVQVRPGDNAVLQLASPPQFSSFIVSPKG